MRIWIVLIAVLFAIGGAFTEPKLPRPQSIVVKANFACGLKPLPPLGCVIGACVCDQNGQNCQWTTICR